MVSIRLLNYISVRIAINQGISQVEKEKEDNMKSLTGGLDLSSFM